MMPHANSEWPPTRAAREWLSRVSLWAAWYSGDPEQIRNAYRGEAGKTQALPFWRYADRRGDELRAVHMPIAGDIAQTSATLLFGEAPKINLDDGTLLKDIAEGNNLEAYVLEAAEMAAGLGGVFLKVDAAPTIAQVPLLSVISPTNAYPVFLRGRLHAVTLWRTVKEDDSKRWVLFEERRRGGKGLLVSYALFTMHQGCKVGEKQELNAIEETKSLGLADGEFPIDGLGVVYVANMLPNRLRPGAPEGLADWSGCLTLMDSLDEAWSSWMRDIRLGKLRLMIEEEFLGEKGDGDRIDDPVMVQLKMGDKMLGNDRVDPIKAIEFKLRVEEHAKTCAELVSQIVDRAGYNPQTFGLQIEGTAQSGTALRIRERKSFMTRSKKERYWRQALRELLRQAQLFAPAAGASGTPAKDITVELADSIVPDTLEQSETLRNLRQAEAISSEMAVRMQHPEWEEEDVQAEVKRIKDEIGGGEPFEGTV